MGDFLAGRADPSMIAINVQVNEKVPHDRWGLESYITERCVDWIEPHGLRRALKMHSLSLFLFLSLSLSF